MEKLLTIEEAAEALQISVSTLYKWVCKRRVPYVKLGRNLRFNQEELQAWLRDKTVKPISTVSK